MGWLASHRSTTHVNFIQVPGAVGLTRLRASCTVSALIRFSALVVLIAACSRSAPRTTPARVPPPPARVPSTSSSESHAPATTGDSTREYSGEWESGVETSVFRGCNRSVPASVWVTLAPDAVLDTKWSDNPGAHAM